MLCGRLTAGLLAGVIAVAAGAPMASTATKPGPALAHPHGALARLIVGNLGRLMVMHSEMNVTDQQRREICGILETQKKEIAQEAKNVWEKRTALCDAVLSQKSDEAGIRQAADKLGDAIGDAAVLAAKVRGEIDPVLTKEQKSLIGKYRHDSDRAVEQFFVQITKAKSKPK